MKEREPFTPEELEKIIPYPDKKVPTFPQWEEVFDHLKKARELMKGSELIQEEGVVRLDELAEFPEAPVVYWIGADEHKGSPHVDYEFLAKHIMMVRDLPNVRGITVGDEIDNGIFETLSFEQMIPVDVQFELQRKITEDLNEKIDAKVLGNHEEFTFKAAQYPEKFWGNIVKGYIFAGMGRLLIQYGEQEYEIGMAHTYRLGRSSLNPALACKRLIEYEYHDADIAIVAHDHVMETLTFYRGGKRRGGIRAGCYKIDDRWARMKGIAGRAQRGGTAIMLYPDKKKFLLFDKIEDAVAVLFQNEEISNFGK